MAFRAQSLKQKLLRMNLVSMIVAFTLTMIVVLARNVTNFMSFVAQDLRAQARIVGFRCEHLDAPTDEQAAREAILALSESLNISQGIIYSPSWKILASYTHPESPATSVRGDSNFPEPVSRQQSGFQPTFRNIGFFAPVSLQSGSSGTIYLRFDNYGIFRVLLTDMFLLFGIAVVGILLGSVLYLKLQRRISEPIRKIIETMHLVSQTKDYSHRVEVVGEHELAILGHEFNAMLERLQEWKREIQSHRQNLENLVKERTAKWQESNQLLHNELSERQRTMEELHKKGQELETTTRELAHALQAEKRFIASMSHEMRNPLNGVLGFIQVLFSTKLEPYQTDLLKSIRSCADHLLALICDILDASKIDAGQMELVLAPVDLKEVLTECIILIGSRISPNVAFHYSIPEFDFSVLGDERRIKQIFLNLLGNAAKFTEEGEIRFSFLPEERRADKKISLSFRIDDTGIGIPPDRIQELFQPFRQLNQRKDGTGLGLFISKALAGMMGGGIEITSRPGKGTTAIVSLILSEGPPLSADTRKAQATVSRFNTYENLKILLVEDLPLNVIVAQEILGRLFGITHLDVAENGSKALKLAGANTYDLALMDIQMPVMDGITAARKLREAGITFPIIAMSANAFADEIDEARKAGMNDYITKPIIVENLAEILQRFFPAPPAAPEAPGEPGKQGEPGEEEPSAMAGTAGKTTKTIEVAIKKYFLEVLKDETTAERLCLVSLTTLQDGLRDLTAHLARGDLNAGGKSIHKLHGALLNCGLKDAGAAFETLYLEVKNEMDAEQLRKKMDMLHQDPNLTGLFALETLPRSA